jgi:hypothetical protein
MAEIDMARDDDETRDQFALGVRAAVERFISPPMDPITHDEFAQRYWPYVQQDPNIAIAHAAVKQAVSGWPRPA